MAFLSADKLSSILGWHHYLDADALTTIGIVAMLMSISHLAVGLHETKLRENFRGVFRRCVLSFGLIFLAFQIFTSFITFDTHNITLVGAMLTCSILQSYWRHWAISQGHFYMTRKRLLFLGAGERAAFLPRRMRRDLDRKHISILGFLPIERTHQDVQNSEKLVHLESDETIEKRLHLSLIHISEPTRPY